MKRYVCIMLVMWCWGGLAPGEAQTAAGVGLVAHPFQMWNFPTLSEMPRVRETLANRRGGIPPRVLFGKIPAGVRWAGPEPTFRYLQTHDLSHIIPVEENPRLAANPRNVVFEPRHRNRARGAVRMTWGEQFVARTRNLAEGSRQVGRHLACDRNGIQSGNRCCCRSGRVAGDDGRGDTACPQPAQNRHERRRRRSADSGYGGHGRRCR